MFTSLTEICNNTQIHCSDNVGAYRSKPYLPFTEQETAHGLISLYYIYLRNTKIYAYKLLSETMVIFL